MKQRTIKYPVSICGVGLHFGNLAKMILNPAKENTGIVFYTNQEKKKIFKVSPYEIFDTMLATKLGENSCFVSTIEHLLAALHSKYITNIEITIIGNEIPILDGSALNLINLLSSAGIQEQSEDVAFYEIKKPIRIIKNDSYIEAFPYDDFKVEYIFSKDDDIIGIEHFILKSLDNFDKEISSARTFGKFEDLQKMKELGLIKGGSLENAIVYSGDKILNSDGLRYKNEFVRHKILDFIGDIYCLGPIKGFFNIKNSGHSFNNEFCRFLLKNNF